MPLRDDLDRADLLLADREELAVLAWGWAQYTHGDLSISQEREAWQEFDRTLRAKEWFRPAVLRLMGKGLWSFDIPSIPTDS